MSHEQPSTSGGGRPAPTNMSACFYLALIALPLTTFWLLASVSIADRDHVGAALGLGIVLGAGGLLCWGLYGAMLFQHPAWPWSADVPQLSDFPRGEAAFAVAWLGFVGAACLAGLAPFAFTLDALGWPWQVWALGTPLVILVSCAPASIVLLRAWRRSLLTRETR